MDGKLIQAKKIVKTSLNAEGKEEVVDLGLVGDPIGVNTGLLQDLLSLSLLPVIAPIGYNIDGGGSLNINADTAAGAVAEALKVIFDRRCIVSYFPLVDKFKSNKIDNISISFFPHPIIYDILDV